MSLNIFEDTMSWLSVSNTEIERHRINEIKKWCKANNVEYIPENWLHVQGDFGTYSRPVPNGNIKKDIIIKHTNLSSLKTIEPRDFNKPSIPEEPAIKLFNLD